MSNESVPWDCESQYIATCREVISGVIDLGCDEPGM